VNPAEARSILQLYRPGTDDALDPQIAAALALARQDSELARWLAEHCDRQITLRNKFRQIAQPPALKEQIISEQAAANRSQSVKRRLAALAAAVSVLILLLEIPWHRPAPPTDTLEVFQHAMMGVALRGYGMDLTTNNLPQIRSFLAQKQAPADFQLSDTLKHATINGCAVESWQAAKVSMICFHTPKSADQNNLWLFVVDQGVIRKGNLTSSPAVQTIHQLITATWVKDGKLYLLGTQGSEVDIRPYL
jgi:hypothetical protein